MSAYVVMLREQTMDSAAMALYASLAPLAREGHPVTPLVKYGRLNMLEGPALEGCLIDRFPTMQAAKAWYTSPQYQQALTHRHQGAQYRGLSLKGLTSKGGAGYKYVLACILMTPLFHFL